MNPRKKKRIEEILRREISGIVLHEMRDPRVAMTTLTRIELAEDQRSAKVFLLIHGEPDEVEGTLATFERARGFVQGLIAKRCGLRWTPVLSFQEDTDLRTELHINALIDQAISEDQDPGD
jgi:ribosome-binding factor A